MVYRFLLKPRWLVFSGVCALAMALMLWAGLGWQLSRYHEKNELKALLETRLVADPVPFTPDAPDFAAVTSEGVFDDSASSTLTTSAGFDVYSVIALQPSGSQFLVRRGFISAAVHLATDPPPPSPGAVSLIGRIRPADAAERRMIERIGPAGIDPLRVLDVISSSPPDDVVSPPPAPSLPDASNNLSYVGQWSIFAVCVGVGWTLLVRRAARRSSDTVMAASNTPI